MDCRRVVCTLAGEFGGVAAGLPTGAFSSVFPTPLPYSLFLREINTHTPQSSYVWPLSRLVNYFPPLQGSWIGERMGLCSFNHGEKPSTGPASETLERCPLPPPPSPGPKRGLLRSAPNPGDFLAGQLRVWIPAGRAPRSRCHLLTTGWR